MTSIPTKNDPTPTISHVGDDGTLIELLYDPATKVTTLAVADHGGAISIQTNVTLPTGEKPK